jgi:ketosteroid isomerase-like protein
MSQATASLEVADKFFAAISRGDLEAVRGVYAPDARIWHNNDGVTQGVDANLRVLAWVVKNVRGMRYDEVRRQATPTGFVQQHVVRGTAPNGKPIEIPACIVCAVAGGRITHLDEYLDSAHITHLLP